MVEGGGFEPPYPKGPDLQSGAFNRSAIPPQRLGQPQVSGPALLFNCVCPSTVFC